MWFLVVTALEQLKTDVPKPLAQLLPLFSNMNRNATSLDGVFVDITEKLS